MEWKDYWLKAKENLDAASLAHQNKKYNACASRAYYAVFLNRECLGRNHMRRRTSQYSEQLAVEDRGALTEYLAALEKVYPAAKGAARVFTRQDKRVIVSIPLPTKARERMRLFDYMAEVATKLLIETGQYIILSGL